MTETSRYLDKRSEFFSRYFSQGSTLQDYLQAASESEQKKWMQYQPLISLGKDHETLLGSFKRKMNILVLSGIWCGDCARQGAMWNIIENASPVMNFRFLDNRTNPELAEELRLNGALKVPVVVVLSEDFFEVARFGDRHLSVYRRKAKSELGASCDAGIMLPDGDELNEELREWVLFFERTQLMLRLAPMLRRRYND